MIALLLALLLAPAEPPVRYACDPSAPLLRLGVGATAVWLGPFGVRLGQASPVASDQPLAKMHASVILDASDGLQARARNLDRCDPNGRCTRVQKLPFDLLAAVPSGNGMLLAVGGTAPGLYRAGPGQIAEASLLVQGEVMSLCPTDGALSWAVITRDGAWLIARVEAEVALLAPTELVAEALVHTEGLDPLLARHAVDELTKDGFRRPREAARLHEATDPKLRSLAPRLWVLDPDAEGTARLWQLAHDDDSQVRLATLEAVVERCPRLAPARCDALASMFLDDSSTDVSWSARDVLLHRHPERALAGAPSAYKLDAVSQLASRQARHGRAAVRDAVQLLIADDDPVVRRAALVLDGQYGP